MNIDWKELVLIFVMAAEEYIKGTKRGAERKEWVINKIYNLLPDVMTALIPRDTLDDIIENAVTKMKTLLAESAE